MKTSLILVGLVKAMQAAAAGLATTAASAAQDAAYHDASSPSSSSSPDDLGLLGTRTTQAEYDDEYNEPPKATPDCDGPSINQTDYAVAVHNMAEYCRNNHIERHSLYASAADQAVVYACSKGGTHDCSEQHFRRVHELLDAKCPGKPGHVSFGKLIYGRDVAGRVLCRAFNFNAKDFKVSEGRDVWVNGKMWDEWKWGVE